MDLVITILPVVTKDLPISPRFTPYNFLSRCKFSTLTTRQPMVEFYLLTFPRFPLRKKEHKSYFGKNRTHDFRTSRCAAYLLDHSGDERSRMLNIVSGLGSLRALCGIVLDDPIERRYGLNSKQVAHDGSEFALSLGINECFSPPKTENVRRRRKGALALFKLPIVTAPLLLDVQPA